MIIENAQELLSELSRNGFWGVAEFRFKGGAVSGARLIQTLSRVDDTQSLVVIQPEEDRIALRENYPKVEVG